MVFRVVDRACTAPGRSPAGTGACAAARTAGTASRTDTRIATAATADAAAARMKFNARALVWAPYAAAQRCS